MTTCEVVGFTKSRENATLFDTQHRPERLLARCAAIAGVSGDLLKLMEIPPKLKEYIDTNRAPLPPISDPDEPLQIDSLGLIRLVAFLENDLGIRVEDEELLAENFATMRALSTLLESKSKPVETA